GFNSREPADRAGSPTRISSARNLSILVPGAREHLTFARCEPHIEVMPGPLAWRLLDKEHVVASQDSGESLHRQCRKDMRSEEEAACLSRHELEPGLERMVVGLCDIERKDRCPRCQQRAHRRLVVGFHRHSTPTEPSEAVADEHDRLGPGKRFECVSNELEALFDRISTTRLLR